MSRPSEDRDDVKEVLAQIAASSSKFRLGKIMGHTGVYVGRKMAAFAFEDGMGLKIDKNNLEKILDDYPDARPFMPMGHKMNGWIVLTLDNADDYRSHELLKDALRLAEIASMQTMK